jgi:hypothetical protein
MAELPSLANTVRVGEPPVAINGAIPDVLLLIPVVPAKTATYE